MDNSNDKNSNEAQSQPSCLGAVMPRSIPDYLYILIEEAKCKRYGGVLEEIDKQREYCHGQCDTIEIIEEWLRGL